MEPREDRAKPPEMYTKFSRQFPKLRDAWDLIGEAGKEGPLDAKTVRLIKIGIAVGAMREGSVHASIRKARALGISREEIEQIVALAAGTIGMPSTVAVYSWILDEFE
jgi:alkylhydroperoxidase/carboxymuconolactone decarboxylase family protein YurZ